MMAHSPTVLCAATLGRWLFIKRAKRSAQEEVAAMRFVTLHTKIPVPRVYFHWSWRGRHYILMDRVPGEELTFCWTALPENERLVVATQLRDYLLQLRMLESPYGSAICSLNGGSVRDMRMCSEPCGPFRDEAHMNEQLRYGWTLEQMPEVVEAHSLVHPIVFTHGDFCLRNIMVNGTKVTGILDWECAGWFPAHWEHCKAVFGTVHISQEWGPWIARVVPRFDMELDADRHICDKLWWPFHTFKVDVDTDRYYPHAHRDTSTRGLP
jgi:aminoglycoside phosphotransferase